MSNSLRGKRICITGGFDEFTSTERVELAKEFGFTLDKKVTAKTDILVTGKRPAESKIKDATRLRTRIWKAEEFILMLNADADAGIPVAPRELTEEEKQGRADFYSADESMGMF